MAAPAPVDTARRLLHDMLRIRLIEERIKTLYAEQEMRCPTHFSIGQEAAAVGACARLMGDELVTSAHRSHAHYLAKGGDLRAMLAELYGKVTGCARGKGGSMHLIDRAAGFLGAVPIVGSTIPIGVGAALSAMLQGRRRLSMIFFGDAATETGVFHESLNFAAIHALPVVMVCENNLYSVLTPLRWRRPEGRTLADLARGHGVLALEGDGNDADVVWELAGTAVEHARGGGGPAFVELATYRWLEHCGPNDDAHLGYRPPGELEAWKRRDPVRGYTERLLSRGVVTTSDVARVTAAIEAEIDAAVTFARSSPFPPKHELTEHVYAR
ncbi:MAG TPA: thiamine pyrophosphate-dependent dehydrogenase E1 component subunit alpha [Methylomirabilota bacterium]|jgi:pyruvate dehydrogenase E1 component alpha subunit